MAYKSSCCSKVPTSPQKLCIGVGLVQKQGRKQRKNVQSAFRIPPKNDPQPMPTFMQLSFFQWHYAYSELDVPGCWHAWHSPAKFQQSLNEQLAAKLDCSNVVPSEGMSSKEKFKPIMDTFEVPKGKCRSNTQKFLSTQIMWGCCCLVWNASLWIKHSLWIKQKKK